MIRGLAVAACALSLACAGRQTGKEAESPFASPAAERSRELAPDLYNRGRDAWARAEEARRRKDPQVVDDYHEAAELWLGAAVVESERLQLQEQLDGLRREEERWATQLARDQQASAEVATDISRYQARAVALAEAERIASLTDSSTTSDATLDAVLTRARLNLALAEALGASDTKLREVRSRVDAVARNRPRSAAVAESLLLETEALLGSVRAQWPDPRPGASTELVETAWMMGFASDRTASGVVVRSEGFFTTGGGVSDATLRRFSGLLAAFPHGPVACQVAYPEPESTVWTRRVARLVDRFRRLDDPARVSTSMVATELLAAGAVQCTFAAYRAP